VVEIALNVDLMLEGNGAERVDTLLHEMAHAADYLVNGNRDHGRTWREWASRVGCTPEALYDRSVHRRPSRGDAVHRVPPLPPALQRESD
jgi:predicted SprT family Zn-dependent metalloprotease